MITVLYQHPSANADEQAQTFPDDALDTAIAFADEQEAAGADTEILHADACACRLHAAVAIDDLVAAADVALRAARNPARYGVTGDADVNELLDSGELEPSRSRTRRETAEIRANTLAHLATARAVSLAAARLRGVQALADELHAVNTNLQTLTEALAEGSKQLTESHDQLKDTLKEALEDAAETIGGQVATLAGAADGIGSAAGELADWTAQPLLRRVRGRRRVEPALGERDGRAMLESWVAQRRLLEDDDTAADDTAASEVRG